MSARPELVNITCYNVPRVVEGIEDMLPQVQAWREQGNTLPGAAAHKLYATYAFTTALIHELAQLYGLVVDVEGLEAEMDKARQRAREGQIKAHCGMEEGKEKSLLEELQASGLPLTDDTAKYKYFTNTEEEYEFPPVETNILALIVNGNRVEKTEAGGTVGIILEATNFYHEAGGQEGDTGRLETSTGAKVKVDSVRDIGGYLVHWGSLEPGPGVATGDKVVAWICEERRLGCMRNHTTTHLLNSVIKAITGRWIGSRLNLQMHICFVLFKAHRNCSFVSVFWCVTKDV